MGYSEMNMYCIALLRTSVNLWPLQPVSLPPQSSSTFYTEGLRAKERPLEPEAAHRGEPRLRAGKKKPADSK